MQSATNHGCGVGGFAYNCSFRSICFPYCARQCLHREGTVPFEILKLFPEDPRDCGNLKGRPGARSLTFDRMSGLIRIQCGSH